jgi:hypothetical protein
LVSNEKNTFGVVADGYRPSNNAERTPAPIECTQSPLVLGGPVTPGDTFLIPLPRALDGKTAVPLPGLVKRVHRDERAAVSLETILIIGAIALPVLIFLIKVGWPRVRDYFFQGIEELESESD